MRSKRREVNIYKRDMIYSQEELSRQAENVLGIIPNPFDSFEKATYLLKGNRNHNKDNYIYRFTTTTRSTEECIEILKEKFTEYFRQEKYCTIYKQQNGRTEVIFHQKIHSK